MAYNGTGTFNRLYNWATDKVNNVKILASRFDAEMDGFATGLSTCITKDGQSTTAARIPFAQGARLQGSSVIDAGSSFYITPTGGTASRDLSGILGEFISPKHFGATGDGVTDDTAALQLWVARLNAVGGRGYIPSGTYVCTQRLDLTGTHSLSIEGDGVNASILNFTSATAASKGIRYAPATGVGVLTYVGLVVRNLAIHTDTVGGTAIDCTMPNDGNFTNNVRCHIENIDIMAPGTGYFSTGVRLYNTSYSTIQGVKYIGSVYDPTADSGYYYAGVGFVIETQVVLDNIGSGLSLENRIIGCTAQTCQTGFSIVGFSKNIYILASNATNARYGLSAQSQTGTIQPFICVTGCHIDATDVCVSLTGYTQSRISGNRLTRPSTVGLPAFNGTAWNGVYLQKADDVSVSGNHIRATDATAAAGTMTGVYIDETWRAVIDGNVIAGGTSNSIDIGINLSANSVNCKVPYSNQFVLTTTNVSNSGTLNDTICVDSSVVTQSGNNVTFSGYSTGSATLGTASNKVGFYGSAGATQPTVTGSRGGNAALQSLLTQLASLGILVDSSS